MNKIRSLQRCLIEAKSIWGWYGLVTLIVGWILIVLCLSPIFVLSSAFRRNRP